MNQKHFLSKISCEVEIFGVASSVSKITNVMLFIETIISLSLSVGQEIGNVRYVINIVVRCVFWFPRSKKLTK